jgi:hypothetical protein
MGMGRGGVYNRQLRGGGGAGRKARAWAEVDERRQHCIHATRNGAKAKQWRPREAVVDERGLGRGMQWDLSEMGQKVWWQGLNPFTDKHQKQTDDVDIMHV